MNEILTQDELQGEVLTEEEWLAQRYQGIGASDVPAILGLVPNRSAYTIYHEKLGLVPRQDATLAMQGGHALEPVLADAYVKKTGRTIWDPGDFTIYRHPDYEWLFCTPDRFVQFEDGARGPLELKCTGRAHAKAWSDGDPPLSNQVQHQIQMAILGAECGALAGCPVEDWVLYEFDYERSDRLIAQTIPALKEFWDRLLAKDPPPVDGSDSTAKTIKALHPKDNGETVAFTPDTVEAAMEYEGWKEREKEAAAKKDAYKNLVMAAIGDATFGELGPCKYSYKHQTRKPYIQVGVQYHEALKAAKIPHTLKGASEYRVLRQVKAG